MPVAAAAVATPGIMNIMDFQYIGFGDETLNGTKQTCPGGKEECFGNMAEACVRNATAYNAAAYMPFMVCLEEGQDKHPMNKAKAAACCAKHSISAAAVDACLSGPLGVELMYQAKKDTPPELCFPTFEDPSGKMFNVNTKHDIVKVACNLWKGKAPSFCSGTGYNGSL